MFGRNNDTDENEQDSGRPTLMATTPGITQQKFCACPLGTEGELTPGDDNHNPYRSADEREEVERVAKKEKEREDSQVFKTGTFDGSDTGGVDHPLHSDTVANPTAGNDPFAFDDLGSSTFDLPSFDLDSDGPRF